jgi:5-methylcytosine-specific restriction endonuclease McrA
MFKPSGNPRVKELTETWKKRSYQLSCLKAIKTEELNSHGNPVRKCAWCGIGVLHHGNQKYCSIICQNSALAWAYPQKENGLRYLLIRQDFKCARCQYDYLPLLKEIINRNRFKAGVDIDSDMDTTPWYYFKYLKNKVPKERIPEVDHVIPVYKGGITLGIDNHNALCYTCHKVKTASDLSGKRKET